ncbi:hypothetical protein FHR97_003985 [Halomonas stenophila]|uniref:Abasic site processing protein n=1 Tax=Halomonas stenophila TaxID=795312 RepID=A0A7W5HN02_9GAMM|nr:hypothetical protein [Halomonas stenophila]
MIITEPARGIDRDIHDCIPLVLDDDSLDAWLDPTLIEREAIRSAVHHLDAGALTAWPVSTRVNRVAHEGADIAAIEAELADLPLTPSASICSWVRKAGSRSGSCRALSLAKGLSCLHSSMWMA